MPESTARSGVTVVVPTLNRGRYLLDTVRDLLAQEYRPLEILLVDQSDTVDPELDALVAEHPATISHHRVTFRGLPIARNCGWQLARHDLIVYVDDDIRCGPDLVGEHVRSLEEPGVGLCGGGIDEARATNESVANPGGYNAWLAQTTRDFAASGERDVVHVPGGNFSAPRAVLAEAGGLDEQLGMGSALMEETELSLRVHELGYRIRFNGAARLTHLAAGAGGTRQQDLARYVEALAHNRSIVIRRHCCWYQWPVALAWSGKLIAAHTAHARDPRLLWLGLRGMARGWRAGGRPPVCTSFGPDSTP